MSSALGRAIASNSSVTLYYIKYLYVIVYLLAELFNNVQRSPLFPGQFHRKTDNRFTINYK